VQDAEFRGLKMIPESHPLQQLFQDLVGRHYAEEIGIRDPQIVAYVSHLLAEFCEADQFFKIHDAADRPLADVGEMLLESDPVYGPAPSFDRERQVRKHIGDYTLFLAGMFPESINHFRLRRQRLENFVEWVKAGKESYYIVSKFEALRVRQGRAPVCQPLKEFRRMRLRAEHGEERSGRDAASHRSPVERTDHVGVSLGEVLGRHVKSKMFKLL
jgi:hypothetical protein